VWQAVLRPDIGLGELLLDVIQSVRASIDRLDLAAQKIAPLRTAVEVRQLPDSPI